MSFVLVLGIAVALAKPGTDPRMPKLRGAAVSGQGKRPFSPASPRLCDENSENLLSWGRIVDSPGCLEAF